MIFIRLFLFISCLVVGSLWSTQWIADYFDYNPILGKPVFHFGDYPIYWPWLFLSWILKLSGVYPEAFQIQLLPFAAFVLLGVVLALLAAFASGKICRERLTAHGSARWACLEEIRKSGLLSQKGVLLGLTQDEKHYLRHDGPEHICVFAPTRSGKGVGLVIPTLLSWSESVICFDPKGENWILTSGFRNQFGNCIYFDPTSPHSARFNPLLEIRKGDQEVKDVQNIADMLVGQESHQQRPNHWERTAHSFLVGAILHVIYAEPDKTLSGLAKFLSHPNRTVLETLQLMLNTSHLREQVHPVVASSARELLNKAPEELSGVLSTAISFLSLYRDPVVARATSASDFKVSDLMFGTTPVSLYLVVPPSDITRTRPLMRLILNQIGRVLTENVTKRQHRLLWLMDEFPALGRLDFFESELAYMAGYDMKALLIAQSLNQIDDLYGSSNSIIDNCHIRIAFASNDERSAKRISELLGQKTELKEQKSVSGKRKTLFFDNQSISFQEYGRPLLTPSEVTQLPTNQQIVFVAGSPPILAKKLRYYEDQQLLKRILEPVPFETLEETTRVLEEDVRMEKLNLKGISL